MGSWRRRWPRPQRIGSRPRVRWRATLHVRSVSVQSPRPSRRAERDPAGSPPRWRITREPGDEIAPAWSPDGEKILFSFDDGSATDFRSGLATVSPDGSAFTELFARNNDVANIPVWSPDGTRIAFTLFADEIVPYVMDADGSDLARLRQEDGVVLDWTPDGRRILLSADQSFLSVARTAPASRCSLPSHLRAVGSSSTGRPMGIGS